MQGNYNIAGHVFRISSLYDFVHEMCRDYITDSPAEFDIETTEKDIRGQELAAIKESEKERVPFTPLSDGAYEYTAVYVKITEILFRYDIILCHGSVVSVDDRAYMFIAKSGTGKSTHTRMWRELLGSRAVMVNDDKPLVRITDGAAFAYGTPWNGKHHLGSNISVPLNGICVLRRGKENSIRPIGIEEAYPMLLQQVYRMPGRDDIKREMRLIDKMVTNVRLYDMYCNISIDAAEMAYRAMHEGVVSE